MARTVTKSSATRRRPAPRATPQRRGGARAAARAGGAVEPVAVKPARAGPAMAAQTLRVGRSDDALEKEADRIAAGSTAESVDRSDETARISRITGAPAGAAAIAPLLAAEIQDARHAPAQPLPAAIRAELEDRVGADLGGVRVHTGPDADALARELDARAFTVGDDIFFASGEYDPGSSEGRRVLTHEVVHTQQQRSLPAAAPAPAQTIQRAPKRSETRGATEPTKEDEQDPDVFKPRNHKSIGWIDARAPVRGKRGTLHLPALRLPTVNKGAKGAADQAEGLAGVPAKGRNPILTGKPFLFTGGTERGSATARKTWLTAARRELAAGVEAAAGKHISSARDRAKHLVDAKSGEPVAVAELPDATPPLIVVGSAAMLATNELVLIPSWDSRGARLHFDVDHLHELQLGGADAMENFWLWEEAANQDSGRTIFRTLDASYKELADAATQAGFWASKASKVRSGKKKPEVARVMPTFDEIRAGWHIQFDKTANLKIAGKPGTYWTRQAIGAGAHLARLRIASEKRLATLGLGKKARRDAVVVLSTPQGGLVRTIRWSSKVDEKKVRVDGFFEGFDLIEVRYDNPEDVVDGRRVGSLRGTALSASKRKKGLTKGKQLTLPLVQSSALGFATYVDARALSKELGGVRADKLSPMHIEDAGITAEGKLYATGMIESTLPIMPGLMVPFAIHGDTTSLDYEIPLRSLALGPLSVDSAAVRIAWEAGGLGFGGAIDFSLRGVGRGRIEADGMSLAGTFSFDSTYLDPASIEVSYNRKGTKKLAAKAALGLKKGALPGVKDALVTFEVDGDTLVLHGKATLDVPGFKGTQLAVTYDRTTGLTISASDIPLPTLPGVRGGTVSVSVQRKPDGDFRVFGEGRAEVAIGGLTGELRATVDGPRVTVASHDLTLKHDRMTGIVSFEVSNAPLDAEGKPIEGKPRDAFSVWGSGSAAIELGKYLRGSAAIAVDPRGDWSIDGEIAVKPLPILGKKEWRKRLFDLPFRFPLFNIVVAEAGITGGGSLHATLSLGPLALEETSAKVHYEPKHPENTRVTGTAKLSAQASAGLEAELSVGVYAEVLVGGASGEGFLRFFANLGAKGGADMTIAWTPGDGLSVPDAGVEFKGNLELGVEYGIKAKVYIGRWRLKKTVLSETWGPKTLASLDLPLGLDFKQRFSWGEHSGPSAALEMPTPSFDLKRALGALKRKVF